MENTESFADGFAALGSPQRLNILRLLVRAGPEGLPTGTLGERSALPASTLSHHVRAMTSAGLITQDRQGRHLICRIDYDRVRSLSEFLIDECCADGNPVLHLKEHA